jgi:hypothetical protein
VNSDDHGHNGSMEITTDRKILFPELTRFVQETGLADKAKGNLAAKLPRILGQGTTKAVGLNLPPAEIERKMEVASLLFSPEINLPRTVQEEISAASSEVQQVKDTLSREEGKRRLASEAMSKLPAPSGFKDGKFFAGRLILGFNKAGLEWAWSVTPYYPIIKRIPPDPDYIAQAFEWAMVTTQKLTLPVDQFEPRLALAWTLARHFSSSDDVLVTDVMKMFNLAGQDDKFWQTPVRQYFKDLPEAAFVINLINWRMSPDSKSSGFEFVSATLHQAHGTQAKVFHMPMNLEGTDVRPMVYLRRRP